jgi:hypothetical protein
VALGGERDVPGHGSACESVESKVRAAWVLRPFLGRHGKRMVTEKGHAWPFRATEGSRVVGHQAQQGLRGFEPMEAAMRIAHDTSYSEGAPVRDGPIEAAAKRAGRFGVHVLEMCVVMCVGLGVLGALFLGASAVLGLPDDVRQQVPELSALIVAAVLALSMVVWMRFRGTEWRPTLEMAGAAIAAGVVMIAGHWLGIVAENDLVQSVCGVACVAMIAVMLFRFRLYSSHHAHSSR